MDIENIIVKIVKDILIYEVIKKIENMVTIKSFTSLEQSRKLAEILPIESADMFYIAGKGEPIFIGNKMVAYGDDDYDALGGPDVLCWSLAALLEVLKQHCERLETTVRLNKNYNVFASVDGFTYRSFDEYPDGISNLIDACVAMIEKLNELNLL